MNENPFFSIIIPTYNRAGFILNTLSTVFEQTFKDFEVIVVDNCSTDDTLELLKPLIENNRIRFIQHDQNYERAKSRNTGMKNAKGKYLSFLDSDDFMYPDNLSDAFQFIGKNPDCKVFHNLYELVDSEKKPIYQYTFQPLENPLKQIAEGNFLSCIGVFLHQDIYRTILWDENPLLTGSEDYDFALRLVAHYPRLKRIEKVNNGVLDHPQRTIHSTELKRAEERFAYFLNKLDEDPEYAIFGDYLKKVKATLFIFSALMAKETQEYKKMKFYIKKSFLTDNSVLWRKNFQSLVYHLLKSFFQKK